jgi:hypothetical protein
MNFCTWLLASVVAQLKETLTVFKARGNVMQLKRRILE